MVEVMVAIIVFLFIYSVGFGVTSRIMGLFHPQEANSSQFFALLFWFITLPCILGYRIGSFFIRMLTGK